MESNTFPQLMAYLGTPDRPVGTAEFKEFWNACSESERAEFRAADLSK